VAGNENHADIRAALIAAARGQIGREDGSLFSAESLCAEVGISQEEFGRFFPNKEALIAAALNEDVAQLKEIAIAAAEPRVALAVANGPSVSTPAADVWLERRLRVFERALSALEARQEKSEQMLNRSVALLEEKIERPADKRDVPAAAPRPDCAKQIQPSKIQSVKTETVATVTAPAPEPDQPPPVAPKEMEDLLANARRVAREAVAIEPPPKPRTVPRWMICTAACCVLLMGMTALLLDTVAGASVRPDSISRRQIALPSLARVITLADSGDARSQTLLALAYLHGQNIAADPAAALRWGLAAAKQGEPMAQYLVGTFYQDGSVITADPHRAFDWFEAAALHGNLKAMHDLAIAHVEGRGTPHDSARAAAWFNRAAGQGYVDSQFDLAVLYERGDGVRQNPKAALKWYLIAAKAGDNQARERAIQLASEMAAQDVTQVRAFAAQFKPAPRDMVANAL
jgi:AcrR family transcriptional regulator